MHLGCMMTGGGVDLSPCPFAEIALFDAHSAPQHSTTSLHFQCYNVAILCQELIWYITLCSNLNVNISPGPRDEPCCV